MEAAMSARFQKKVRPPRPSPDAEPLRVTHAHAAGIDIHAGVHWVAVPTTDRAFTLVTKQGTLARWVRTRLVPLILPLLLRLVPVRRFLFRTVSQIGVNYRNGPLSVGAAGAVRGGGRLPWVETAPGQDNFATLASLTWQVHVYGELRPGVAEACAELQLPLHVFEWRQRMRRAGLLRSALYLVRPDGYVALADPHADPERLRRYGSSLLVDSGRFRSALSTVAGT
jgi:hypothetical protein